MADEETTEAISEDETTAEATTEVAEEEKDAEYYRKQLREYERNAKKASTQAQKKIADLERKLGAREDADKSEQEKAIDAARKEGEQAARAAALGELRADRLEVAVARLANGIKVKDGDEDKTLKFADPDDAIVHIDRAIKAGDVDEGDIFDDGGKVQTEALKTALAELLQRKPHLIASNGNSETRVAGSADGGKGTAGKSPEDASTDDIFQSIQQSRK